MWKVRGKSGGVEKTLAGEVLLERIFDGLLTEQFEFLPPGQSVWVSRQAALVLLMSRSAGPVPSVANSTSSASSPPTAPPVAKEAAPPKTVPARESTIRAASPSVKQVEVSSPTATAAAPPALRARRSRGADDIEADFDMTPMIDVVFQLLIFFMVAGSISVITKLPLPSATAGSTEDPRRRVVLVLDIPPDIVPPEQGGGALMQLHQAVLYFSDDPERKLDGAQLEAQLTERFDRHKQQLAAAGAPEAGQPVQFILLAHRRAPARLVRQVLQAARQAGATDQLVGVSTSEGAQ